MSSWLKTEVAEAQMRVALEALSVPYQEVEPFKYFLKALDIINPRAYDSLLDVGCGVGPYGVLCQRHYPSLRYYGTDFSPAMIECAHILGCHNDYAVCKFEDNKFDQYDIILLGGVLEYAGTWNALQIVLDRFKSYIILNRIRLTDGPSQVFEEGTYCGHIESHYLWNAKELDGLISPFLVADIQWPDDLQHTLVLRRK
jgi:SAM-dependent methyltransferase